MSNKIGIYAIRNVANGKIYIGSSVDIARRWKEHRYALKNNNHDNDYLQNAWSKNGERSFKFSIVELCLFSMLAAREQFWMDYYVSASPDRGYNLTRIVNGHPHHAEKTKEKISQALQGDKSYLFGRKKSLKTIERIRNALLGRKLSKQMKRKLSKAHQGIVFSDTHKKNLSEAACKRKDRPFLGMHHTTKTKQRISKHHSILSGRRGKYGHYWVRI